MITILAAAAATIPAGAWLRWATRPVLAAYRLGRATGRLTTARRRP